MVQQLKEKNLHEAYWNQRSPSAYFINTIKINRSQNVLINFFFVRLIFSVFVYRLVEYSTYHALTHWLSVCWWHHNFICYRLSIFMRYPMFKQCPLSYFQAIFPDQYSFSISVEPNYIKYNSGNSYKLIAYLTSVSVMYILGRNCCVTHMERGYGCSCMRIAWCPHICKLCTSLVQKKKLMLDIFGSSYIFRIFG